MPSVSLTLSPVETDAEFSVAKSILEDAGLPTTDLPSDDCQLLFAFAGEELARHASETDATQRHSKSDTTRETNGPTSEPVAVGGLEHHSTTSLLRSVAVTPPAQGHGIGTELCDRLEQRAVRQGTETLWLLTTNATEFFAQRGYTRVPRADVPEEIRATTQFDSVCPDAATVMGRRLAGTTGDDET